MENLLENPISTTPKTLRKIAISDLTNSRYSVFAILSFTMVNWSILYQSSSLNVMLEEIYDMEP